MRRFFNVFLITILFCTFLSTILSSCGSDVTQIETILNQAITAINDQPTAWNTTLTSTITQLKGLSDSVTADVENLLSESTALVTAQVQCNVDIVGLRIADSLRYIEYQVKGVSNPQLPTPWICVFVPNRLILKQASSNSPWTLSSSGIEDIYGVNFRTENLPTVDLLNSQGNVVKQNVLTPRLQSAYLLQLDFQPFDFSQINIGDFFSMHWQNNSEQYTLSVMFNAASPPPPPVYEDFVVYVHVTSVYPFSKCQTFNPTDTPTTVHVVGAGWTIDHSHGDPGHPGISEIANNDNLQADQSLMAQHDYNYQAISNTAVEIFGTICSAGGGGPGAIFNRTYRVYLIRP